MKRADEMALSALHSLGVRWERGLDERGASISGGERQSLAIARAMFFGSSLMVLDEPTSALAVRQAGRVLDHIDHACNEGYAVTSTLWSSDIDEPAEVGLAPATCAGRGQWGVLSIQVPARPSTNC